jgi:hypothetical protein
MRWFNGNAGGFGPPFAFSNLGAHPLSSTSFPTGASTFSNLSGTQFDHVIHVAGTCHDQCSVQLSIGIERQFWSCAACKSHHTVGQLHVIDKGINPE